MLFVDDCSLMILEAKRKEEPETERKKYALKFINEIKNDEKTINDEICSEYFVYQTP